MKCFAGTLAILVTALVLGTSAEAQISISYTDMQNILVNSKRMNYFSQYFTPASVDLGIPSGTM